MTAEDLHTIITGLSEIKAVQLEIRSDQERMQRDIDELRRENRQANDLLRSDLTRITSHLNSGIQDAKKKRTKQQTLHKN